MENLLLALVLGFLIGFERNVSFLEEREKAFAGSRTFAIISLLGYLSGLINEQFHNFLYFALLIVGALIVIAYYLKVTKYSHQGSTTHFAAITAYFIGLMVYLHQKELAIVVATILVALLNIKPKLKKIEAAISTSDINAGALLLIMTFIILPILPDKMIGPYHLFNPYKTWMMAVIISSLSFLGYIAMKFFGHYGILITGAAGGFVSSTAVSFTLSKQYRNNQNLLYTYLTGIMIANTIMFSRVFVEAVLVHQELGMKIAFPYILTTVVGFAYTYWTYKKSDKSNVNLDEISKNPLELDEAIKFAIIFGVIFGAVYFVGNRYGNIGIYLVSFFSGITDVDAITLSLSSLSKNEISIHTAGIGITIAAITNSLFKLGVIFAFGGKKLGIEMSKFFFLLFFVLTTTLFLF